jgi:hypothetical protein
MDPQPLAPEDADQWLEAVVEPLPQLSEMLEVLRRRCGIDFSGYKTTTLTRRARQRMARLSVLRPEDYLEMLQEQGGEREALSSELLVNVTEFFRDTEVFRQLEEQVRPTCCAAGRWGRSAHLVRGLRQWGGSLFGDHAGAGGRWAAGVSRQCQSVCYRPCAPGLGEGLAWKL